MSNKLIFIMSDSEVYLRDEVLRISSEWGFNKSNVRTIEGWDPALVRGSVSLFGEVSMIHLDLSDNNKLKAFVKMTGDKATKNLFKEDNWFGPGLIITSIHARGAKKVENLITKFGGSVQKKAKPAEMKKTLFNRVSLSKENKDFLDEYVGDEYQDLIGIINQIDKLDEESQESMTIEDLIVRLPSKPGSLPPWEFINPMLDGNAKDAVDLYERAVKGSHVLVTMSLAKSKLQLLYRLKALQLAGITQSKEQAEILGERNGPNIWITANASKKVSMDVAEFLAKLALVTEADLKGYSNADQDTIFKNFIAMTCLAIKFNRTMPIRI